MHIEFSLDIKFYLKLTILKFWIDFAQKVHLQPEKGKVNINIELCIFELDYEPNFILNYQF